MFWFLGLIFTLVKGQFVRFMGSEIFALDFLTIATAYLFLLYGLTGACVFALVQGAFIDIFSGGLNGLFTFLYVGVFCGIWLGSRFFNLRTPKGQVVIVFVAMLWEKALFIIMLFVFSQHVVFPKSFLWVSGALAIGTCLIAPVLFYLFNSFRAVFFEDMRKASTEEF